MQLTALLLPFREFLFPPLCSSCRRLLDNYQTRICSVCWETIRPITPMDTLYRETRAKLQATSMVDDLIACFSFDEEGALPTVIHQLKYAGASAIVVLENFAKTLEEVIGETQVKQVITTAVGDMLGFPKSLIVNFVVKYRHKATTYRLRGHLKSDKPLRQETKLA